MCLLITKQIFKAKRLLFLSFCLFLFLCFFSFTANAGDVDNFTDIADYMPRYENALRYIVEEKNVMSGTSPTSFSPDMALRRCDLMVVLCSVFEVDVSKYDAYSNPFTDVPSGSYYERQVKWAYYEKITSGTTATTFSPSVTVDRQSACLFFYRFCLNNAIILNDNGSSSLFADDSSIGSMYKEAVYKLYRAGIVSGDNLNKFNPSDTFIRIYFASLLLRYYNPSVPKMPVIRAGYANGVEITCSWVVVPDVKKYQIRLNGGNWSNVYDQNSNLMVITFHNLVGSTNYTIEARSCFDYSNTTLFSPVHSVTVCTDHSYFAKVDNYFDNGYSAFYYGSASNANTNLSRAAINRYMDAVSDRYLSLLDLIIERNDAKPIISSIDQCKGTVNNSNIHTLCSHSDPHTVCFNSGNASNAFYSWVYNNVLDLDSLTEIHNYNYRYRMEASVFWTAHDVLNYADNPTSDRNRSFKRNLLVFMLEQSQSNNRERNSKSVLMHELNHYFGAVDHYHELAVSNDPFSCKRKNDSGYCSNSSCNQLNGTTYRPASCIMNQGRLDISSSTVLCEGCKNDMKIYLNQYCKNDR